MVVNSDGPFTRIRTPECQTQRWLLDHPSPPALKFPHDCALNATVAASADAWGHGPTQHPDLACALDALGGRVIDEGQLGGHAIGRLDALPSERVGNAPAPEFHS